MTTLHDALERRVSATRAASSLQGVLQRHVETLRWALLESHRASGLLGLNVTEANLREAPADVAGLLRERNSLEISTRVGGTKHVQVGRNTGIAS